MLTYCIDFIDDQNNLSSTVELAEDDDAAAIQHAHIMNNPSIGGRFEVWQSMRRVHKHHNS